jgi:hypothetical protein
MLESNPFNPLVYWPHVVLGISSIAFALIAIGSRKGGQRHRQAGRLFAITMSIAALTAAAFSFVRFGPPLGADGLLSFPVYFFGPFFLIPAIYFLAMPQWLKAANGTEVAEGREASAA